MNFWPDFFPTLVFVPGKDINIAEIYFLLCGKTWACWPKNEQLNDELPSIHRNAAYEPKTLTTPPLCCPRNRMPFITNRPRYFPHPLPPMTKI